MKKLSARPVAKFIESLDVVEKCDACHGGGVLPGSCGDEEHVPCPHCHGKGVLVTRNKTHRHEEIPCTNPGCHGGKIRTSRIVDGNVISEEAICPVCEGYGVINRETEEITPERTLCPVCEGTGTLTAGEMRARRLEDLCPACHGTGLRLHKPAVGKLTVKAFLTFCEPAVAVVCGYFKLMLHSVRAMLKH